MSNLKYIIALLFSTFSLNSCGDILRDDISTLESVAQLSADELISALENNENFNREKILSVKGTLVETNTRNDHINFLIKGNSNQNHYIICEMNHSFDEQGKDFTPGDTVIIKGVLKGYLNDAVLLNCVLENPDKK
ncbi:OB-fold protein [Flagellimonas marina]|uniref:tRNA_anti-like n=1 Tax=Flagellimonas marina TaxID=1775168 RepID=A0ABV8PK10_9FLAO